MKKNYSPLTKMKYDIIGVSKGLYYRFGPDHQEELYDADFPVALEEAGFEVIDKPKIEVLNARGEHLKFYYPDFRVRKDDMQMLVELKADPKGILQSYIRQARAYLRVSKEDAAILIINFARAKKGIPENESIFRRDLK